MVASSHGKDAQHLCPTLFTDDKVGALRGRGGPDVAEWGLKFITPTLQRGHVLTQLKCPSSARPLVASSCVLIPHLQLLN